MVSLNLTRGGRFSDSEQSLSDSEQSLSDSNTGVTRIYDPNWICYYLQLFKISVEIVFLCIFIVALLHCGSLDRLKQEFNLL